MKLIHLIIVSIVVTAWAGVVTRASAADEDGVAVAIIYDTSGSMDDPVKDAAGNAEPKYRIANRALVAIANRIQAFAVNTTNGSPRKIETELLTFDNGKPHVVFPLAPFNPATLTNWANHFASPDGGTPLGNALRSASQALMKSGLTRKHVLVITDGMNTVGPEPAPVLARMQETAMQQQTSVAAHFVAFDVDAKVFEGVKKLGATVVGASDEKQLNDQLEFILEKKILLEDEEAPAKKP